MQRPRSLTEGSISLGMFKFALPILLANILQSLNGSVNSIWVGRYLGEAALTATSVANTVNTAVTITRPPGRPGCSLD